MLKSREFWKQAALSVSLANLIFLREWAGLLHYAPQGAEDGPQHPFYESLATPPRAFLGMLAAVAMVALALGLLNWLSRRSRALALLNQAVWVLGFAFFLIRFASLDSGFAYSVGFFWKQTWGAVMPGLPAAWAIGIGVALLGVLLVSQVKHLHRFSRLGALILFPLTLNNFAMAAYRSVSPSWAWPTPARVTLQRPKLRVVWFVFDKWDYYESFVRPSAKVKLPALAEYGNRSIVATNAFPPGPTTDRSFGAYLLGRRVSAPLQWSEGKLTVGLPNEPALVPWNTLPNVFDLVHGLGARSAALGFYLPYCRMLASAADYCYRMPVSEREVQPFADSILGNGFKYLADATQESASPHGLHRANFMEFRQRVTRAVGDPSYDLIFVHWPVPHEPYFYDSATGTFPLEAGQRFEYDDNLNLVNRLVEEMDRRLEDSGQAERTVVLMTSDHPAYRRHRQGQMDPRVPFYLHFPNQIRKETFDARFSTLAASSLVVEILAGKVEDVGAAVARLQAASAESWRGFEPEKVRLTATASRPLGAAAIPSKGGNKRRNNGLPRSARSGPRPPRAG